MSGKLKAHPLNAPHSAGIYADPQVDGPEIGTLVAVVDRAKNLPNRKTIGKQDPYCAARLGKEAKKTTTDIRGGQTPKWDQELRFQVHDSPDYYQLKVSVFHDDKKTDLIGETWIDLRDIIVPGGGQNDLWHSLSCKGKYAGEVRIEITFYDSRPKPDKVVPKSKPVSNDQQDGRDTLSRSPVKRRPLPSDPVTGEAPAQLSDHAPTPPRAHPKQPTSYIPNQSPLQAFEYNTPPPAPRRQPDPYSQSPQVVPQNQSYGTPPQQPRPGDRHDNYDNYQDERDYSPKYPAQQSYDRQDPRGSYGPGADQFDMNPMDDQRHQPPMEDDRPPPPPAHRSRHTSGNSHDMPRNSFDTPPKATLPMRHDVLKNEAHRRSVPSYPGRPAYRAYDSAPTGANIGSSPTAEEAYHHPSPPRHHSYDAGYDPQFRALQPTVEDAPESPTPLMGASYRRNSYNPQYDDMAYDQASTPAPLNLSGRGSAASGRYTTSPQPSPQRYDDFSGRQQQVSPLSARDYTQSPTELSYQSHSSQSQHHSQRTELDSMQIHSSANYGLPPVPPSLVPGVDPALAQEVSDRIYEERRQERRYTTQNMATPPRGRQPSEPMGYGMGSSPQGHTPQSYDRRSGVTYSNGPEPQIIKPRAISPNPNPHHTIKRKSVSPAPPTPEGRASTGVPFGPDSYNAFNPSLVSAKESTRPDYSDPNAKIIAHDGREIDPSDHLPMDTWAPEPEPRVNKSPDSRPRPSPSGAQPMPSAGRRQLRVAGRPQSMAAPPPTYINPEEPSMTPPTGGSGGRNRLQKKSNRMSTLPPSAPQAGPSPLAPLSSHNHQGSGSGFTPPRMPRASTWDFPSENHAPQYGSSPGGMRGPPIPAKVPLPIMSGAMPPARGGGGDDWALMQEMSQIDIGAGRSRRHRGY